MSAFSDSDKRLKDLLS